MNTNFNIFNCSGKIDRRGSHIIKSKGESWLNKKNLKHIYWKLFVIYTIIIACIVLGLEIYFISSIRSEKKDENLRDSHMVCMDAAGYIQQMSSSMANVEFYAYQMDEVLWLLKFDTEKYLEEKLKNYSDSKSTTYYGVNGLVKSSLNSNPHMESIAIISDLQKNMTRYYSGGSVRTKQFEGQPQEEFQKELLNEQNNFMLIRDFKDPITGETIGSLMSSYRLDGLEEAAKKYGEAYLIAFYKDGRIFFRSDEGTNISESISDYVGKTEDMTDVGYWEERLHSYVEIQGVDDIYVMAYIPFNEASSIPTMLWATLICMGMGLFAAGEFFVHLYLKRLTNRLNNILAAMEKVSQGDLTAHIQITQTENGDELDVIAVHFNQMCVEMESYIQKSYLAEIEQKNAELSALQSQINPHFLYNTLEVIRMKAICNGDKEVGKMLYSLAVLFRSQVKENNRIPIAKELHYCKKYLELFEYRYHNKFSFCISCPEELMDLSVIKFIIQPVIENYFVHGIRLEADDNHLNIDVTEEQTDVFIYVRDNGKGMSEQDIEKKNCELRKKEKWKEGGSIGIQNVHTRIEAVYGKGYGLTLSSNGTQGLCVALRLPGKERTDV